MGGLLGRETELAVVEDTVSAAVGGEGALLLLEGPAGIGKTALLSAVTAGRDDARVLAARASELDRGFAFGVVRQLFEMAVAEDRAGLLSGAAGHAAAVLDPAAETAGDTIHAVLHGCYWLVVNLAERTPLVLVVDDLHWCDEPSLRFIEYLGRRLEGQPVAVIGTLRPNEPGAPAELLDELRAGPAAAVLRPGPLGEAEVATLLEEALGAQPHPALVADAVRVTGGNPLLVSVLAREAATVGVHAQATGLPELGARSVAPAVERRLRPLGPVVGRVARAAAVLGERATAEDVAALAELDAAETGAARDALAGAEVLTREDWGWVHPLVRAAVLDAIPASERAALHRRAALALRERGARSAAVAPHWRAAAPAGDDRAVADLRAAAREADAEGATAVAADHLARALAEPPASAEERRGVALELGELEVRAQRREGPERLRALLGEGLSGDDAARARAALANQLVHSDPFAAVAELEQGVDDAADPVLQLRLEAALLEALLFVDTDGARLRARIARGRAQDPPSVAALAAAANDGALRGLPTGELIALCDAALADGRLLATVGPASSTWNLVTHALRFAEDAGRSRRALEAGEAAMRRQGLLAATLFVEQTWGYWHRDFGSVALGAARSRSGLEAITGQGMETTQPALSAILAENLIELDRLDEAAAEVDGELGSAEGTFIEPFVLTARGRLRGLLHRLDEAEADLRRVIAFGDARGWAAPNAAYGRLRLAEVLAARGEREEVLELMDRDARSAEAAARPGCLGMALRRRARALEGDEAIEQLEEAAALLAATDLRREEGWALHDLGARLRVRGDRRDAREPLRKALDLASRTEATRLGNLVRGELEASGARPRRERLDGVEALTPAERRVAQLAAEGLGNRAIAEQLWVTLKTVEVHLGRAYAKLGISSRRELAGVLGAAA